MIMRAEMSSRNTDLFLLSVYLRIRLLDYRKALRFHTEVKWCGICLLASNLVHLTQWPGSSILSQMARLPSYSRWMFKSFCLHLVLLYIHVCVCVYLQYFNYFTHQQTQSIACYHALTSVNNVAMNVSVEMSPPPTKCWYLHFKYIPTN